MVEAELFEELVEGDCESAMFGLAISDAENSSCDSNKLPSVTKALFRPPDSIRQSESCLRRHKQQLFASLPCLVWFASLEQGTRNAVLSRLPEVSVQQCTGLGGCSADNELCSAIFQCYTYNM